MRRVVGYKQIERAILHKRGLEIGGPSDAFSPSFANGYIPAIYSLAASVDNCNFAIETTWSRGEPGRTFRYLPDREPGLQFIHDATDLTSIPDSTYDFLLSSHVLEHVANPLGALQEFNRVLKPGGSILLLVPNRVHTFDHRRPVTSFEHLQEDFAADRGEDDLTHVEEMLALHDLTMGPPAGTPAEFRERTLRNAENRCMHHHVFSLDVLDKAFRTVHFKPVYQTDVWANHLLMFGKKL